MGITKLLLFGVLLAFCYFQCVASWSVVRIDRVFNKGGRGVRHDQQLCDSLNRAIITRDEWGAVASRDQIRTTSIADEVVVWHTGPDTCDMIGLSGSSCELCLRDSACMKQVVLALQDNDFVAGLDDIKYNFLIDQNGVIYEGRGWNAVRRVSKDSSGLDVALVGDFTENEPSHAALDSLNRLVTCGVQSDKLLRSFEMSVLPSKAGRAFSEMVMRCDGLCLNETQ